MIAALFWLALETAAPRWIPLGETSSRLRVFIDGASVHDLAGRRQVRIRIGAPRAIVGRVVISYQDEEFDCAARTWRLLAFEARDEDDKVVQRGPADLGSRPMLPIVEHSIGGEVAKAVCPI